MEFLQTHKSINAWAKDFANGDGKAAEKLFNYFYPIVFRYVRSRMRDEEVVNDICQDVFLKVARGIRLYDTEKGNFSAWLWQIVRNVFTDHLRSKMRKKADTESVLGEDFDMNAFAAPETSNAEAHDDLDKVMGIVKTFSDEDQELFRMRYIAELSFAEIADMTGRSENALTVALHRIREKIKKAYER